MTNTTIKIKKNVKQKIDKLSGSTIDKKLNILMNNVEHIMPFVEYSAEESSIYLSKETLKRLDSFRISLNESRDNILTRLLLMQDEINNTSYEEEWISFKLTNPYNNQLVIEGQLEYYSSELSFNYRGNVYLGKLPPNYIVKGKDLTKELYLWYDNLDWRDIKIQLTNNITEQEVIKEKDYILEINMV